MSWYVEEYQSGSVVVRNTTPTFPWLSVHAGVSAMPADSEGEYGEYLDNLRMTRTMANEVAAKLNGGPKPKWIDDTQRIGDDCLQSADGGKVQAVGPAVLSPSDPEGWQYRDDEQARLMRKMVIDKLLEELAHGRNTSRHDSK